MDDLFTSFKKLRLKSRKERRQHPRKACFVETGYMVHGRWYRGSIQNISEGGVYVRSNKSTKFSPGEDILLVARIRVLRDQLRGKIAWVGPHGMGVEIQASQPDHGESEGVPDNSIPL
jgi:hypothetical protein